VKDQKLIGLLNKMFNAKIINLNGNSNQITGVGVLQNNPLSPLFSNIYLDKLDEFLEKQKPIFDLGLRKYENPVYRMFFKVRKISELKKFQKNNLKRYAVRIRKLKINRNRTAINIKRESEVDKNNVESYCRIYSVRYADNLLIGFKSKKSSAHDFIKKLTAFLKNDLHFEIKKLVLKHAKSDYVQFLGFSVSVVLEKFKKITYLQNRNAIIKMQNRIKARKTNFYKKYVNYIERNIRLKLTRELINLGQYLKKGRLNMTTINKKSKTEVKKLLIEMVTNWAKDMKTRFFDKAITKEENLHEIKLIEQLQKDNQLILNECIRNYMIGLKEISLLPEKVRKKLNELNELIDLHLSESRLQIKIKKIYNSKNNTETKNVKKNKMVFDASQLAKHKIFIRIPIVRIKKWFRE